MATIGEVEATLAALIGRLTRIDATYRAMLPARRTIEAFCTDVGVMYHAYWRNGRISELFEGPADRPDIRIQLDSDALVAMSTGLLDVRRAYTSQRLRIDASMTDLLRLRAAL